MERSLQHLASGFPLFSLAPACANCSWLLIQKLQFPIERLSFIVDIHSPPPPLTLLILNFSHDRGRRICQHKDHRPDALQKPLERPHAGNAPFRLLSWEKDIAIKLPSGSLCKYIPLLLPASVLGQGKDFQG